MAEPVETRRETEPTPRVQAVHRGELGAPPLPGVTAAGRTTLVHDAAEVVGERALVDARAFAAALDPADEVGLTLAHAVQALRDGAPGIVVRVALGTDLLMQIAKLRALRATWARVRELTGVDAPMIVWAGPDAATWTVYDPWVNLLRNTAGTFAALVGGADHVTPIPWDAALGEPDAHARRLADNTFRVLVDEAHLGLTADPAAGSWAIEAWSADLAAAAWATLTRVEAAGGPRALGLEALAAPTRAERARRIVKRLDGILGTSLHPNLDELRPARAGAPLDRGEARAAPFEALRRAAEAHDPRPSAFLVGLGPVAEHATRLGWVKGLYEVAGVRALGSARTGAAYDATDAGVAACVADWRVSGSPLAVLCGADERYRDAGAAFVAALKAAGARVTLAGRPKDLSLAVDAQVYAGMDVVAGLAAELAAQGIPVSGGVA
ncbi:MAG: hypothetical protein IT385_03450 [Deltaproteobacteria bacterium]|nr:hypothetical protein [Deltaproteobacteria bacterium]